MKKILAILIIILLLPKVNIYSAETVKTCLIEAETGKILAAENADTPVYIGTLVKIMTWLIVAEKITENELTLNTSVIASPEVFGTKGASIWLTAGEKMTVEDLLKASIIGNANDATAALAEHIAGNQQKFTALMNTRAFELGMKNTVFTDCTGLDDNSKSTAQDLAILCREITKYQFLVPIMSVWRTFIRGENTELVNENTLTRNLEGLTGIKASHSQNSGYSVAISVNRNDKTYIAIVLNSDNEDDRFTISRDMINSAFTNYTVVNPSFSSEFLQPLKVKNGIDTAVEIEPEELKSILISKGRTNEVESVIFLPNYVEAPVKKGQRVGNVAFYIDDTLLYETPLIAKNSVEKFTFKDSLREIIKFILT